MSERKAEQFARQSREAAAELAKAPLWMQRNLEPPKVSLCGYADLFGGPCIRELGHEGGHTDHRSIR